MPDHRVSIGRLKARLPERPLDPGFLQRPKPSDPDGRSLEAVLEERAEGW